MKQQKSKGVVSQAQYIKLVIVTELWYGDYSVYKLNFYCYFSYGVCQEVLYGRYKFPYAWFSTFLQCIFYGIVSTVQYYCTTGHLPSYRKKYTLY